jgi:hypothetical protein
MPPVFSPPNFASGLVWTLSIATRWGIGSFSLVRFVIGHSSFVIGHW